MTYEEAEKYLAQNRNKIDDNFTDYKLMVPIIASNTAETRKKERMFEEVIEKGVNDDTVLRNSGGINSDLNVFFICQGPNGLLASMPFSDYLEMISQKERHAH